MTDLRILYMNLGFENIETYIQSGNVVFSCPHDLTSFDASKKIEEAILEKFKYKIPVLIRNEEELRFCLTANPFLTEGNFHPSKVAVILLYEEPTREQIHKVINVDYPPDKFKIIGREIFIFCPDGFGKTKLYTNFFENKMGVTGTARNWKTITTIYQLAVKRLK